MHCGKNNLRMVLLLAILGIAMLFCGMATEKSSNIDKIVENISLEQEHSAIDLMNFPQIPKCIALNKNGDVAIEYKMSGRTKITILFSNGEKVQYALSPEGNCAIDLTESELLIYLVRSQAILHVGLQSGAINTIETEQNNMGELYGELCELSEIQKGEYTVRKVESGKDYHIELNGKIILQTVCGARYYPIAFVGLTVILIAIIKCPKLHLKFLPEQKSDLKDIL